MTVEQLQDLIKGLDKNMPVCFQFTNLDTPEELIFSESTIEISEYFNDKGEEEHKTILILRTK